MRFIIRGQLLHKHWVWETFNKNLPKNTRKNTIGIMVFDVKDTKRLRGVDVDLHTETPAKPMSLGDKSRKEGYRHAEYPGKRKSFYVLAEGVHSNWPVDTVWRLFQQFRHRLDLRDFLIVERSTTQLDDFGNPAENPMGFRPHHETVSIIRYLAFIQIEDAEDEAAYLKLTSLRHEMIKQAEATGDWPIPEIIPVDVLHEGIEYVSREAEWTATLGHSKQNNQLVPVGWFDNGSQGKIEPTYPIHDSPAVVLGATRTGKSVIAYQLLARYLKLGFSVIFANYKSSDPSKPSAHVRQVSEFADFACVVEEIAGRKVRAVSPDQLKQLPPCDSEVALYTEMCPNVLTAKSLVESVLKVRPDRWIICFDEALNQTGGGLWDETLAKQIKDIDSTQMAKQIYPVIIHQKLADTKNHLGECGDIWKKSTAFMRRLETSDADAFRELVDSANGPAIAGLDAAWDSLPRLDLDGERHAFAVAPVLMFKLRYKPVVIQGFPFGKDDFFLSKDKKLRLEGRLDWGQEYGCKDLESAMGPALHTDSSS